MERPCPGERVTFTCTIESAAHRWEVSSLGFSRSLVAGDLGRVFSDPPFEFNVTGDMAGSITSTATVNATTNYNDTIVVCQDGIGSLTDQSTTINIIGEHVYVVGMSPVHVAGRLLIQAEAYEHP